MSYIFYDPDEWETVSVSTPTSCSIGQRRRSPEAIAKIKAEKLFLHEEAVLAEAARIKARRQTESAK